MNKKNLIITTICIAIAIIFAICIVSTAAYSINQTINLSVDNLVSNKNYFCGKNGVDLGCYVYNNRHATHTYKNKAVVTINKNQAAINLGLSNFNITSNTNTILGLVFNQIKDSTDRVRDVGEVNGQVGFSFGFDYGQAAIWHALGAWNSSAYENVNSTSWTSISSKLQTAVTGELETSWNNYESLVNKEQSAFSMRKKQI